MSNRLRPFFSYFGSKYRLIPLYSTPKYDTIIEPFAGSAAYSSYYHTKNIILYDLNQKVCGVWDFLINCSEKDIRSLPDVVESVENLHCSQEAKWLIGFWLKRGQTTPALTASSWYFKYKTMDCKFWGPRGKDRLISQCSKIKHWKIFNKSYLDSPHVYATWFIDPPYEKQGKCYPCHDIDYTELAGWAKNLPGQAIVCESNHAKWLPFKELKQIYGIKKHSMEMVWEQNV